MNLTKNRFDFIFEYLDIILMLFKNEGTQQSCRQSAPVVLDNGIAPAPQGVSFYRQPGHAFGDNKRYTRGKRPRFE